MSVRPHYATTASSDMQGTMCGRFTLTEPQALPAAFPQFRYPEFSETRLPRYNIAPTQDVLGVRNDGHDTVEEMRWGVRGRINIRAESIAARRSAVCDAASSLPTASTNGANAAHFTIRCTRASRLPSPDFGSPGNGLAACDVVTCRPNALVAAVHDRMPVILSGDGLSLWLDPEPLPPDAAGAAIAPARPCADDRSRSVEARQ